MEATVLKLISLPHFVLRDGLIPEDDHFHMAFVEYQMPQVPTNNIK